MTPRHHPGDDLLMAYVTAALPHPMEAAIAAHLTLCPACRDTAADLEAVAGEIFAETPPTGDVAGDIGLQAALDRLDAPPAPDRPPAMPTDGLAHLYPAPIRALAGHPMGRLPWRPKLPGVAVVDFTTIERDGAKARLVRTDAGGALPSHTHRGLELTLILAGGLTDQHGHFRRGDLLVVEPGISHRPAMDDDEDCVCLGVTDGAVILDGVIGRMRQILSGY